MSKSLLHSDIPMSNTAPEDMEIQNDQERTPSDQEPAAAAERQSSDEIVGANLPAREWRLVVITR